MTPSSRSRSSAVALRSVECSFVAAQGRHRRARARRRPGGGRPRRLPPAHGLGRGRRVLVERMAPPGPSCWSRPAPTRLCPVSWSPPEDLDRGARRRGRRRCQPRRTRRARIRGLRAAPLFTGGRGRPALDVPPPPASRRRRQLLVDRGLELLELNPVLVHERGATVVDALALRRARPRVAVVGAGLASLVQRRRAATRAGETWSCSRLATASAVGCGRAGSTTAPSWRWARSSPGNTAVVELAERFGLGLADKGMRYGHREPRGVVDVGHESLAEAAAAVGRALDDGALERGQALARGLEIQPGAREALLARVEISSANDADLVARNLGGIAHVDEGRRRASPTGTGACRWRSPSSSASACGWAPVERIAWGDAGVRLAGSGASWAPSACVVAVPTTPSTAPARFRPALPAAWRTRSPASAGAAAKLFVRLRRPPRRRGDVGAERYWCWTATGAANRPSRSSAASPVRPHGARRPGRRRRPARWLRVAGAPAAGAGARARRRAAVHLVGRPLGGRGVLHLPTARARGLAASGPWRSPTSTSAARSR